MQNLPHLLFNKPDRSFSLFHFPLTSRLLSHFKDTVIFRHAGLSHLQPPNLFYFIEIAPPKGSAKLLSFMPVLLPLLNPALCLR